MRRVTRFLLAALLLFSLSLARPAAAAVSTCEPDGLQSTGAVYRTCMPETWNGDLMLFAHGYVDRQPRPGIEAALPDSASRDEYRSIVRAYSALP